ncbi:flagellar biosynthetic protein FliO [Oscillospiraceae bacterium OttesenSCG-928-G22]|nr:flagellar biosynthetic protein FliO [Oscillospiraceae bacterium OttesenSCG-928-G22]
MMMYLTSTDYNATLRIVLAIFLCALLLVALYFVLRWMSKSSMFMAKSSYMRVLDRVALSKDAYLALVEIAGQVFAICVTRENARVISDFDVKTILDRPIKRPSASTPSEGGTFLSRFFANLRYGGVAPPNAAGSVAQSRRTSSGEREQAAARSEMDDESFEDFFRTAAGDPPAGADDAGSGARDSGTHDEEDDMVEELLERISEQKVILFEKGKKK